MYLFDGITCIHPDFWPQNRGGWIGDFPPSIPNKNDFYIQPRIFDPEPVKTDWNEIYEKLKNLDKSSLLSKKVLDDKNNFYPQEDGNLVFVLEMPGYGREHISIKIKNNGKSYLEIEASNNGRTMRDTFYIPDELKYNLHSGEVIIEYGILSITFEAANHKKQEISLL